MTVQRFGTSSAPCPNGLYVRHSDYAALEAECERLRAESEDWRRRWSEAVDHASALTIERNNLDAKGKA